MSSPTGPRPGFVRGGPIGPGSAATGDNPPPWLARCAAGNILDRIDAAVQERCACGCDTPLDADGPSAYYATPECQARWMRRHADRPEQVTRQPDAAPVHVGADGRSVPLRPGRRRGGADQGDQGRGGAPVLVGDASIVAAPVRYLLACGTCREQVPPLVYESCLPPRYHLLYPQVWFSACPTCGEVLPGAAHIPAAYRIGPGWLLELRNETGRIRTTLLRRELGGGVDQDAVVARSWRLLERRLAEFRAGWHPDQGSDPGVGGSA